MDIDPPSTSTTTSASSFPFNTNPPSDPFSPFPFASTSTSPYPSYPRTQPNQPYITLANNANTNFHIAHPNPDPNLSPWSNEATDVDMQDVGADFSEMLSAPVPTSPSMSMRASANASAGAGAGDAFQTNVSPPTTLTARRHSIAYYSIETRHPSKYIGRWEADSNDFILGG